jgi:hypothetical protein
MKIEKQFTFHQENKPGKLAGFCRILAEDKINILAITIVDHVDTGVLRVIVDKPDRLQEVIKKHKLNASVQEVLTVELPHRPGSLGEIAEKLASAKVNIEYLYTTALGKSALIVMKVSNIKKAQTILS